MLCFVREKQAQLTHGTRGKELSTGMDGHRGWMSEIVFPLMDMKKDPLGCLTCPQKLKGGLLSFLISLMRL